MGCRLGDAPTDRSVCGRVGVRHRYKYNQHTTFHTFKATLGASDGKRHDDKYVPPLKAPLPRVVSIFRDHAFKVRVVHPARTTLRQ